MSDARTDSNARPGPWSAPLVARSEVGLLPCPDCAALAPSRGGECPRCTEPLFSTGCTSCPATMFAGHAFCMACGTAAAPKGSARPATWAEGTPVPTLPSPGPTAPFARLDAGDFAVDDDAPTRIRRERSAPTRRLAVRPSRGGCPRCRAPLVQRALGNLDLDECHGCGGVFLDVLELTRLVFDPAVAGALVPGLLARAAIHPARGGTISGCPVCRERLVLKNLATPAGRAAVCRRHGAWLEPSSLAAAARELADGILTGGERERAAFRDDVRHSRYEALLAHARALRGRTPGQNGPLSTLAALLA